MTLIRLHLATAMLKTARYLHLTAYALTDAARVAIRKAERLQGKAHRL